MSYDNNYESSVTIKASLDRWNIFDHGVKIVSR